MATELKRQIASVLDRFNSIENLTWDEQNWRLFLKLHWHSRETITINNKFNVTLEHFEKWQSELGRCGKEHAEYDPQTGKITFKPDHCPVRRTIRAVMNQWLCELELRLRRMSGKDFRFDPADGFRLSGQHEGCFRTTDLHLRRGDQKYPTVVVEIAFAEPTQTLFQRAKMWLDGTNDTTQLVMLFDIKEGRPPSRKSKHVKQGNQTWNLTDEQLASRFPAFWPLYHYIISWYYQKGISLTGRFSVDMYLWGSDMPEPDKVWGCVSGDYMEPPVEDRHNGIGTASKFCFYGMSVPFPIEILQREINKGIRFKAFERAADFAVEKLRELNLPFSGYLRKGAI